MIGAVPSAARVVLYSVPTVPLGRLAVVIVGVYFTLSPRLFFIPSSSMPPSTITLWPLAFRLAPSSSVRLSPSPMVMSSCKVTLPYTVPFLPSKTMPPVLSLPVSYWIGEEELFAIPPLARTMALLLTVTVGVPEPEVPEPN